MTRSKRYFLLLTFFGAQAAFAHVTISPRESSAGQREQYTMRVPTERDTPTVRIEAEFPAELSIASVNAKEGWRIESRKDSEGRIVGTVWSGGSIRPGETEEFGIMAQNPAEEATLVWRVIQVHADGSRAEWLGERGSRAPAPVTVIRKVATEPKPANR